MVWCDLLIKDQGFWEDGTIESVDRRANSLRRKNIFKTVSNSKKCDRIEAEIKVKSDINHAIEYRVLKFNQRDFTKAWNEEI